MTYLQFLNELSKKNYHSVYYITGKEEYLVEDAVKRLVELFCEESTRDFNLDVFHGDDVEAGKIVEIASSYPMMAENRTVVVKEIHRMPSGGLDLVAKFVERVPATTRMIFTSSKPESKNKAIEKIKKRSCQVICNTLYDREIPAWINNYVKKRGFTITEEAVHLIHTRVGNNLREIINEIEKILVNLENKREIKKEDVQELVGISRSFNIFELTDAIGAKDLNKALYILDRMLQYGESPTGILAMITRHFSNLMKVKGALQQRKSYEQISALTGIPKYFMDKTVRMASNFTFEDLTRIFSYLLETDLALKTSKLKPQIAMESLLIQIVNC